MRRHGRNTNRVNRLPAGRVDRRTRPCARRTAGLGNSLIRGRAGARWLRTVYPTDDHLDSGTLRAGPFRGLDAVLVGHRDVHHHEVGWSAYTGTTLWDPLHLLVLSPGWDHCGVDDPESDLSERCGRHSVRRCDPAAIGRRMGGGRTPLLQPRVDAALGHAVAVEHRAGHPRGDCVGRNQLTDGATECPPLEGQYRTT